MLERRHRLTDSVGFTQATRRGARAGSRTVVLHLATAQAVATGPRIGFVVSKAVGNAVTRNRVRRRLRHLARERVGRLPDGSLLVVRALPPAADATYDAMARDFDGSLLRLDRTVGTGVSR